MPLLFYNLKMMPSRHWGVIRQTLASVMLRCFAQQGPSCTRFTCLPLFKMNVRSIGTNILFYLEVQQATIVCLDAKIKLLNL